MISVRKIAFSSNAFKKNTLAEAIDFIGDIGYVGAEIMADVPHAYPASFDSQQREELLKHMAAKKLVVSNVNAFTHFADGDTYHPTWIEDDDRVTVFRAANVPVAVTLAAIMPRSTLTVSKVSGESPPRDQGCQSRAPVVIEPVKVTV